jgi:hypothetical protein
MPIRLLSLPMLALLAACATTPEPAAGGCNADAAHAFVGHAASTDAAEAARKAAGADLVRVIKPGQAVTMDFRGDRLNLYLDDAGLILRASCG